MTKLSTLIENKSTRAKSIGHDLAAAVTHGTLRVWATKAADLENQNETLQRSYRQLQGILGRLKDTPSGDILYYDVVHESEMDGG